MEPSSGPAGEGQNTMLKVVLTDRHHGQLSEAIKRDQRSGSILRCCHTSIRKSHNSNKDVIILSYDCGHKMPIISFYFYVPIRHCLCIGMGLQMLIFRWLCVHYVRNSFYWSHYGNMKHIYQQLQVVCTNVALEMTSQIKCGDVTMLSQNGSSWATMVKSVIDNCFSGIMCSGHKIACKK